MHQPRRNSFQKKYLITAYHTQGTYAEFLNLLTPTTIERNRNCQELPETTQKFRQQERNKSPEHDPHQHGGPAAEPGPPIRRRRRRQEGHLSRGARVRRRGGPAGEASGMPDADADAARRERRGEEPKRWARGDWWYGSGVGGYEIR